MKGPSLWTKCANAINTNWNYSWYWPETDWHAVALKDAEERRDKVVSKLVELQQVITELKDVLHYQKQDNE